MHEAPSFNISPISINKPLFKIELLYRFLNSILPHELTSVNGLQLVSAEGPFDALQVVAVTARIVSRYAINFG